jgi:neurofibromin 1
MTRRISYLQEKVCPQHTVLLQDERSALMEISERNSTYLKLEPALLLCLCSSDNETLALAVACLQEFATESLLVEGPAEDDAMSLYRQFLPDLQGMSGKMAQQKRIRKLLRAFSTPREGLVHAWEEAYRRWTILTASITNRTEESEMDVKKKMPFGVKFRTLTRGASPSGPVDHATTSLEEKPDWPNLTGFLCALGGCISAQGTESNSSLSVSLLDRFLADILELLVCDNSLARETVKEVLGGDLSTGLFPLFFSHLVQIINKLFGGGNSTEMVSDRATFHVEQAIAVLKLLVDRGCADAAIDFGSLILSYARYLNLLGDKPSELRIKMRMCQLVETLIRKRESVHLQHEIKLRNKLLETFVEWTSDFAQVCSITRHHIDVRNGARRRRIKNCTVI